MTTRNRFGELVFGPSDAPADFREWLDGDHLGFPDAAVVGDDETFGWCADIQTTNAPGYAGKAHNFESCAQLLEWLAQVGVPRDAVEDYEGNPIP